MHEKSKQLLKQRCTSKNKVRNQVSKFYLPGDYVWAI